MLVDKQNELMSVLLFTVHQHGGDDVTWKPPIARLAPYFRKEWQSEQNTQAHVKINTRKEGYFPTRFALLAAGTLHACSRGLPVNVLQHFWEE